MAKLWKLFFLILLNVKKRLSNAFFFEMFLVYETLYLPLYA